MHVKLRVMQGSSSGKEIALKGPKFVIGRAEECHMRARSDAISRRHCAVLIRSNRVTVRDLGSRNGTYVNGTRIDAEHSLNDGDRLQVGPLEFLVVVQATDNSKVRFAEAHQSEGGVADLVGQWLEEPDADPDEITTPQREIAETRRHRTDDTDKVVIPAEASEQEAEAEDDTRIMESASDPANDESAAKKGKGKKVVGKLPPRPPANETPKNTQEAAAEMLKKLFHRR